MALLGFIGQLQLIEFHVSEINKLVQVTRFPFFNIYTESYYTTDP